MKRSLVLCGLICLFSVTLNAQVTWSKDVAQLIYTNCTSCHNSNGIAPFSLVKYSEAVLKSTAIRASILNKTMPPWIANSSFRSYAHERVLSDSEIETIVKWVDAGVPEGNPAETPPPPVYGKRGFILQPADLELKMPVYTSKASPSSDDYVCFSVPSALTSNKKIRAFEVIPGNHNIVHHALVYIDQSGNYKTDTTGGVCTGPATGLIGGYVPGSPPTVYPANGTDFNLGFEMGAGANVILAMHYPEGSKGMVDSTLVRFWFYDDTVNIRQLVTHSLIENWDFVLPPDKITQVNDQFKSNITDLSLLSIFPHMHLLGKNIRSFAVTPNADTLKLVDIPDWDFEWQEFLFFRNMIKLPKGSTIYGQGHYDNTSNNAHNPRNPPVQVRPGLNTTDEMFLIYFHFLNYAEGDENRDIDAISSLSYQEFKNPAKIKVYPNPVSQHLKIEISEYVQSMVFQMYDIQGKRVGEVLRNGPLSQGDIVSWNIPEPVQPGIYHYSLNLDGFFVSGSVWINP